MSSSNQPRSLFGLRGKELVIAGAIVVLLCVGIGAAALVASRMVSTISTALRVTPSWTPEATRPLATVTLRPSATPLLTATRVPTPMQTQTPAPTSTPEPGQSRGNPLPSGSVARANGWQIRVVDVMRGGQAAAAIQNVNQFNSPAPEGQEYVAIKVHVKSVHTDSQAHRLDSGDFRLTGDRLVEYMAPGIVPPEPALKAEMFSGGEAEGWLVFAIGQNEGRLLLDFDPLSDSGSRPIFIALTPDAVIPVDPQLADLKPTDRGLTHEQPGQLGETLITEDWAVTILESIRGEQAWQMTLAANQFNDPPSNGREYLAVRARVRNLNPADETVRIDSSSFKTIGSANVIYDAPSIVEPSPPLEAALYPGGEVEGWVVLQIGQGEDNVQIVFDPIFDFEQINRRFIAVEQ
jgi:hypothetical protein